jgi:formate-dependent nitrite reductase cytochrome c552 subunit
MLSCSRGMKNHLSWRDISTKEEEEKTIKVGVTSSQ